MVCHSELIGEFNPQSYSNGINHRNLIYNFDMTFYRKLRFLPMAMTIWTDPYLIHWKTCTEVTPQVSGYT